MILYCYDQYGVYTGPVSPALSPARPFVGGKPNYLRPARSTDQVPPEAGAGSVAVFDGSGWSLVEDHRGEQVFDIATKHPGLITAIGPVPEGFTVTPPPTECHVWDGGQWVEDTELMFGKVRSERNAKLAASDWTQMADSPLTREQKDLWAAYRQELRDFPDNWTPDKSWPQPPQE